MKLALNLGYWSGEAATNTANIELALEAERLGFDSVWAAEAYGSDAATVLSWIGAKTARIGLGSAIFQIPGRSPAMTSMTAATLDALSGGRFRLGIGVSGPQVSEGWHGVRFDAPLARTREYLEVLRMALGRDVVKHDGVHYPLPLPDGPGRALRLTIHPVREEIPILLAAVGPKNLELAGELADGWLAVFLAADFAPEQISHIQMGRDKAGKTMEGFEVMATMPIVPGRDLEMCANLVRPYAALYVGGMGSRDKNFYNNLVVRMGYEKEAEEVQNKYLARDYDGAMMAIPFDFLDQTSLLGGPERMAEKMQAHAAAGVTTLALALPDSVPTEARIKALRMGAEAFDKAGVAS
jgi:F420-dependent oxidoreductase-like protein